MTLPLAEYLFAVRSSDIAEGSMLTADVGGKHLLLSRIGGEVFAVGGTCTHEETDLGIGFQIEGRVVCPLHLSQFDLKTGEVLNPPATVPLEHFNVKIEGNDVFVEI